MKKSSNLVVWRTPFPILAAIFLTGCISITPPTQSLSELKTEEFKNYQINNEYTVNVGDPVIIRKSYFYKLFTSDDRVQADNNFHLEVKGVLRPTMNYYGKRGEEFAVLGTTITDQVYGGTPCRVVSIGQLPDGTPVGMLVDSKTGTLTGKGAWRNLVTGIWQVNNLSISIDPSNTQFTTVNRVEIDRSEPYENYEIIYTGRSGENVTFVYREYTPDDLAKPAFYQNLTYNLAESKTIQFRKLQMQVIEAGNENIKLKVLSD